ncbi:MAG TPA: hypothetical protein VGE02_05930 [Gemmatimonadales bacterium]
MARPQFISTTDSAVDAERSASPTSPDAVLPDGGAILSVSVVTYRPDLEELAATFRSLVVSFGVARDAGVLEGLLVEVIDNGTDDLHGLDSVLNTVFSDVPDLEARLRRGHGNVGYGRGHNLSLLGSRARYHLVLNPDVLLDADALQHAVEFLDANPRVGLLTPQVRGPSGERQFLCRAYPSVFVLFLRGFAPAPFRRLFRRYMQAHELRDRTSSDTPAMGIPLVSGCFMFGRRDVLQRVGGFSPSYFMYFEDSDLSLAVGREAEVAYVPAVRIVHAGGGAARKGLRHTRMFMRSAYTFFSRNGWRLV